jgi:CTD small phosphatase-like protein 2
MEIYTQGEDIKTDEAIDQQDLPHDGNSQFLKQPPTSVDSGTTGDMVSFECGDSNVLLVIFQYLDINYWMCLQHICYGLNRTFLR